MDVGFRKNNLWILAEDSSLNQPLEMIIDKLRRGVKVKLLTIYEVDESEMETDWKCQKR